MFLSERIKIALLIILTLTAILLPIQTGNILFFFNELPTFTLGYSLYLNINKSSNRYFGIVLFLVSIVGIFIKHPGFEYPVVSLAVCILIYIDSIKPLVNNFFSSLGDYSYSMYLIHVPVGIYLLGFIKNTKIVQTNIPLNIIVDLVLLILIVFISRFTFEWIELKSIEVGKRLSRKSNNNIN
jgi:peptidoglycan/LPS O-acetylase OafA/YrhL